MLNEEMQKLMQDKSAKVFQAVHNGDLTTLKELFQHLLLGAGHEDSKLLDGLEVSSLLEQRSENALKVYRPSNSNEITIHQPSLLHAAAATWYPDVVDYICSLGPVTGTCSVEDVTNKPSKYNDFSSLHLAAILGKYKMVKIMVEYGVNINAQTSLGDTSLFEACYEGHTKIVKYLIESGADPEIANNKGTTCLMIACYADNSDVIQVLVERGVNLESCDHEGRNVMFYTAAGGSADTLAYLCDNGGKFVTDEHNVTVLMEAAHHHQLQTVSLILDAFISPPCDVYAQDALGRNVLFYTTHHDSADVLQCLLDYGVPCVPDHEGRTLLMACALNGNITLIKFLCQNAHKYGIDLTATDNKGRNCLFYCVTGSNEDVFHFLFQNGVKLSISDDGITPLMQAVAKNKYQFVKHLLIKKAEYQLDINASDKDGWTAMLYSVAANQPDIFELLESYGAHCPPATDGRTIIMQAAATGNLTLLKYILEKARQFCVYINQRDYDGWTALFYTIQGCHVNAFKLLVKRGARVLPALNGTTVLMEASDKGKCDMVEYLVKMAASLDLDINYKDKYGANVLFYCVAGGHINLLKFLLNAGCHVDVDSQSRTLLMQAALCGHAQMVQYLVMYAKTLRIDLNAVDKEERNVLNYCVEGGHLDLLEFLIGCGVCSRLDKSNATLLMYAAKGGHAAITRFILQHRTELGIDLNAKDDNGENAIFFAVKSGNIQVCRMLLDQNIELANNKVGINPLPQCLSEGRDKIVNAILLSSVDLSEAAMGKDDRGRCTFYHSVNKGDLKLIRRLKQYYKPHIDSDVDGCTILMRACHKQNLELVKVLVEEVKCDVHKRDNLGRTALFYAAERSNLPVVSYLIDHLEKLENDSYGNSILMCAITTGDTAVFDRLTTSRFCQSLLEQCNKLRQNPSHICAILGRETFLHSLQKLGCDLDLQDKHGATPLMYACANSHVNIASFLLRWGATIDSTDNKNRTALHYCFYENPSLKCVKLLINYGADINDLDKDGMSPLLLACETCAETHITIISYMVQHGANPCIIDNEGKDAFDHCPFESSYVKAMMKRFAEVEEQEKAALEVNKQALLQVRDVTGLLRTLIQDKVITRTLHFEIMKRPQPERVPKLLEVLMFRGPGSFRMFCKALTENGDQELGYLMMKTVYKKQVEYFV